MRRAETSATMTTSAGRPISLALARLRTRDDVHLDGVFAEPTRRSETALVWVHGLGSVFSSGQPLIRELSARLTRRGHRLFQVQYPWPRRRRAPGADPGRRRVRAVSRLCARSPRRDCFCPPRELPRIVLAGHSTGANKVLYHAAKTEDRRVTGLILLGPIPHLAGEAESE